MWRRVKLGDVCELVYGKALDAEVRMDGNGYPAFGANGIKTYAKKFLYDKPSIIVGRKGSAGEINKVNEPFWALDVTYYIKFDEKCVDLDYLYYLLKTLNLPSLARGVKPGINRNDVYEQQVNLPPLTEQKHIVAKLDAAFAEIDRAERLVEEKKNEVSNIFETMVRRYFVENVLGAESVKLSDVAEYFNGLTYSPKDVSEDGTIVLRSSNIQDGKIELSDLVRVKKKVNERLIVKPSDILICSRNGSKRLIGKSALIGDNNEEMTFGTFMMIVRSELNDYLQWFFKSSLFKQQIAQGEQTAINQITKYMFDEVVLPIPSLSESQQVNEKISSLDVKIREILLLLEEKRQALVFLKSAILAQELQPSEAA